MGPASAGSEDASVFRSLPRTGKSYLQLFSITHPAGKFDGGLSFFGRNLNNIFFHLWKYRVIFFKEGRGSRKKQERQTHKDILKSKVIKYIRIKTAAVCLSSHVWFICAPWVR